MKPQTLGEETYPPSLNQLFSAHQLLPVCNRNPRAAPASLLLQTVPLVG